MSLPPIPTPIFRFLHFDNLWACLKRGALHSPKHMPDDGLVYRTIHNADIQHQRRVKCIACGPAGVIHDYVAFYFGPRSPMLFQLRTGWVPGYTEGQEPLIYLVSTAQAIQQSGARFVFSDGHGIAGFTSWYEHLQDLDKIDWDAVYARVWKDTVDDMDRQRRKQAEFLVHEQCDWTLVQEIGVVSDDMRVRVDGILAEFDPALHRQVHVRREWYY